MALFGTVSPGNPMGFKNRIINGDFRIWQRGTSFTSVASGQYTADRWQLSYRTAGVTIAQQNNTTYYAARLTNTDGSVQSFDFEQRIEDTSQFSNTTYTLSFYAKASTAVTLGVNIYANYGTGGSSQDTVYSNNVSLTTSRAKYTITLPFPDMSAKTIAAVGTGGSYVRTLFSISSLPASAWYEVDSVQVEPGSVATSFDYRPHATEMQLCQRYFEKSFPYDVTPSNGGASSFSTNQGLLAVYTSNTFPWGGYLGFKVTKRVSPTMGAYGNSSGYWYASGSFQVNAAAFSAVDSNGGAISQQAVGGSTITAGHWTASAEL